MTKKEDELNSIKDKFDDLLIRSNSIDTEKENLIEQMNKQNEEFELINNQLDSIKAKNKELLEENLNLKKQKSDLESQIMTLEAKLRSDSRPSMPVDEEESSEYNPEYEDDDETKDNKIKKMKINMMKII